MGSHGRLDLELYAQTHSRIENDNILQYYLHDEISSFTLVRHQTSTQEYQLASELFINLAIDQLDSLIDLDQSRQYDQDERDIRIYSLLNHSGWEQNTVGQVTPDDRGWSNQWNNTSPSASLSDLDVITNQLGIDPHQELHLKNT